jgi:predicted amidophosphoribosyltransferase
MNEEFGLCPTCKKGVPRKENDGQHCEECGTIMLSECPRCEKPILSGTAKFCRFCGVNYFSPQNT